MTTDRHGGAIGRIQCTPVAMQYDSGHSLNAKTGRLNALARLHGKTKEEKDQNCTFLQTDMAHFVLTHNPKEWARARERLKKFEEIARDKNLAADVVEEGRAMLGRMPKLEAQRNLRKEYEKLADGEIIKRGQQQPFGQVARGAEDDEGARVSTARCVLGGGDRIWRDPIWRRDVHDHGPFGSICPPNSLRIADKSRSAKP